MLYSTMVALKLVGAISYCSSPWPRYIRNTVFVLTQFHLLALRAKNVWTYFEGQILVSIAIKKAELLIIIETCSMY